MSSPDGGAANAHAARQRRAFSTLTALRATLIFAISLVALPLPNISSKPIFITGLLVFGAASAAAALSPSFLMLIAMRFVQRMGAFREAPAALSLLRGGCAEPAACSRAMASWGHVSVLGASASPVISGVIITWLSWRQIHSTAGGQRLRLVGAGRLAACLA